MSVEIEAPVAGVVVDVHVAAGQEVKKDQYLFTMEKAKTLLIIRSTMDGCIETLNVSAGDELAADFVAVTIAARQD